MKDIVLDFLANNASQIWTQIWTLLSVVAGGIVTYITTSRIESKKSKRQFQQKKLEEILISYCTSAGKYMETIQQNMHKITGICQKCLRRKVGLL